MLADKLAEAVAYFGPAIISVYWLRWFPRLGGRYNSGAQFLDRADADPVRLPQSAIDRASFGHSHFSAANHGRNGGWVGITVANKTFAGSRFVNCGFEDPARTRR